MSIKAPGGEPYRYKLTLEVAEEDDSRTFSASGSCSDEIDLADAVAYNIGRMLGIMNEPPNEADLVDAMSDFLDRSPLALLAALQRSGWTGENNLGDCFKILVNVNKLCGDDDECRAEHSERIHHLVDAGVDLRTGMSITGHSKADTFLSYDRRDESRAREAVELIAVPE